MEVKGGDITTNQTTFNLINTNATSVNFAGAAASLNIGSTTGNTTIASTLTVNGTSASIASTNNASTVNIATGTANNTVNIATNASGTHTIGIGNANSTTTIAGTLNSSGDFNVATDKLTVASATGNTIIAGTLTVNGTSANIASTNNASTVNIASGTAGNTISIGSASGTNANTVRIAQSNAAHIISIGSTATGTSGNTINIATGGTGSHSINIGNTSSTTTVNGNMIINEPISAAPTATSGVVSNASLYVYNNQAVADNHSTIVNQIYGTASTNKVVYSLAVGNTLTSLSGWSIYRTGDVNDLRFNRTWDATPGTNNDKDRNDRFVIRGSDGNVGIGKIEPGYKLDVSGDIHASGWCRSSTGFYLQGKDNYLEGNTQTPNTDYTQYGTWQIRGTIIGGWGGIRFTDPDITLMVGNGSTRRCGFHYNGRGNGSGWGIYCDENKNTTLGGTLSTSGSIAEAGTWLSDKYQAKGSYQAAGSYANLRGNLNFRFDAKLFKLQQGWWIGQANYLKDDGEGPLTNVYAWRGSGADDMAGEDLVFTRLTDNSTVWIRSLGDTNLNAINMTGQHGLHSLNKELKNNVGYIACVSSEGYWDENQKYFYKNKKRYIDINDCLPMIRLSNKKKEKSVIGVISNKRQDFNATPLRYTKLYQEQAIVVNSIGEGAIWVSNINGNIENGDYITSSDIPGVGMRQDDDILHNYTVAKITMDCDFEPKWIQVMKTSTYTSNILSSDGSNIIAKEFFNYDSNNNYIFEPELDSNNEILYEWEYDIKYVRLDGTIIDKNVYDVELSSNLPVYKMAFVGCTYHSG